MEKYIIWNFKGEPEQTEQEYSLGEIIIINSNTPFKCVGKQIVNNTLIQHLKKGKIKYEF